jgi:hypothetical protein
MSLPFAYDPTTDLGKVRLEIGDTDQGEGVKPSGGNYSDEELQVWLTREGNVMRAAAAACEALAVTWAREVDVRLGPRSESASQASAAFAKQAARLRNLWGDTPTAASDGGGMNVYATLGDQTLHVDYTVPETDLDSGLDLG